MGTVKFPVPVNRSGENFSPNPFCAPPPLGREMIWLELLDLLLIGLLQLRYVYVKLQNLKTGFVYASV